MVVIVALVDEAIVPDEGALLDVIGDFGVAALADRLQAEARASLVARTASRATRNPATHVVAVTGEPLLGVPEQSARLRPEVLDHVLNPSDALKALDRQQRPEPRVIARGISLRLDEGRESREGFSIS
jgi:hypothetical protein